MKVESSALVSKFLVSSPCLSVHAYRCQNCQTLVTTDNAAPAVSVMSSSAQAPALCQTNTTAIIRYQTLGHGTKTNTRQAL